MSAAHTQMFASAARVLCDRMADACEIDREDAWKEHYHDYMADAKAALEAASAMGLLSALQVIADGTYDTWTNGYQAQQIAITAIAKATGETA